MLPKKIEKMSVNEKIILIEEIWDSLQKNNDEIKSPKWHKGILEKRMNDFNNGESDLISIEDLKKE